MDILYGGTIEIQQSHINYGKASTHFFGAHKTGKIRRSPNCIQHHTKLNPDRICKDGSKIDEEW